MRGDRRAYIWARSMDNIENTARQAGFGTDLTEQKRGHRRELTRLCDRGISDRDGGRDFPAQQIERQVPRRDQARDAAGLAQGVVEGYPISDVGFVFGVENGGREKTKIARGAGNIQGPRKREGFAGIDRFRPGQLFQVALDQVGYAKKNLRPLLRGGFRPGGEGFLRSRHCELDVAAVAFRNLRIRLARRRFDVVEIFCADRLNELAIDEIADLE